MKNRFKYIIPVILTIQITWSFAVEPSTLLGMESGKLLKCRFQNLSDCTLLGMQESAIRSLAVAGESVYLGLQSGELRRCSLTKTDHCVTFHNFFSHINDLAISRKNIYGAWNDGIMKCGLRKSEDCTQFYASELPVLSITVFGSLLYAGTEKAILSWPINDPTNSTVTEMTSPVHVLGVFGNLLYAGLQDGRVESCKLDDLTQCTTVIDTSSEIKALDVFDDIILISSTTGDIIRFEKFTNDSMISDKVEGVALTMFTIYATTKLEDAYKGEGSGCTWQDQSCPPFIMYYDIEAREQFELEVKNGKLYHSIREEYGFDTNGARSRKAIFVMDPAGRIYASIKFPKYFIYHSSLMAGEPVAAAGQIKVRDGEIVEITTCSEHYKPSYNLTIQILSSLKRQGYDRSVDVENCEDVEFKKPEELNKTDIIFYVDQYNN